MLLIFVLVALGLALTWRPLRALIPSESAAAFGAVAVALVVLLRFSAAG